MLCVVINGPTLQEAHQQISRAQEYADLVELRLDYFLILDFTAIKSLKDSFAIPMIFTLRSILHGGHYRGSEEMRLAEIRRLADLNPEYLDLENHIPPSFIDEISSRHPEIKLILSYHNFHETPADLTNLLREMQKTPAFFYKIAVTAVTSIDALRLISWAKNCDGRVIAISMGPYGQISRIIAPVMGIPITYAALNDDHLTAPGQLTAKTLIQQYHHRSLNTQSAVYGLIGDPVSQSISDETHNHLIKKIGLNLKTAIQDDEVTQDMGIDHSQTMKATHIGSDYSSKDCDNLPSSTAVSRLNAVYVKMEVKVEELSEFFRWIENLPFKGLSVTMPLKEAVIPFLDLIEPQASIIGAVNTLIFENETIAGFNTDGIGALNAIEHVLSVKGKEIILLGAGGAAKAIAYEAHQRGGIITILNRDLEKAKKIADKIPCQAKKLDHMDICAKNGYDILINCTPLPMPIESKYVISKSLVMDIKTKPKETAFLKCSLEKMCPVVYGYQMFVEQAVCQFKLWLGDDVIENDVREILNQQADRVLN